MKRDTKKLLAIIAEAERRLRDTFETECISLVTTHGADSAEIDFDNSDIDTLPFRNPGLEADIEILCEHIIGWDRLKLLYAGTCTLEVRQDGTQEYIS